MNILIVGNVLKDVYLRVDTRTEKFEKDGQGVDWLNLSFDAKSHHFFSRLCNYGGAAVSLEVLQKLGLSCEVVGSSLSFTPEAQAPSERTEIYRYILTSDEGVTYFTPTSGKGTEFAPPEDTVDYLYIDRSAALDTENVARIADYLLTHNLTKLVLYLQDLTSPAAKMLLPRADLIFYEDEAGVSDLRQAFLSAREQTGEALPEFDPSKIVMVSEKELSFQGISEQIVVDRIDMMTRLSVFSTAAATILGCFVLGKTVEESLRFAKLNVENATLNSVLTLQELSSLDSDSNINDLELIAAMLTYEGRGILAADESGGSIKKKFEALKIPDTFDKRHSYRDIFLTAPELDRYLNGVILFDETARDVTDSGENYVSFLISRQVIPGIKVDQGLAEFPPDMGALIGETWTKGLDGLSERLREYYLMGLRFAKWRAAFVVNSSEMGDVMTPSNVAIVENCRIMAEYARTCQSAGLVPIVEPEVVYDGNYPIEICASVTARILDELFKALESSGVNLRACILKTNMILAGKQFYLPSTPEEVGRVTATILREHVPEDLAGVVFLSGGQGVEQATANLAAIIANGPFPWPVTFSFARALQDPTLYTWGGDNANIFSAQEAFVERLVANTEALKKK